MMGARRLMCDRQGLGTALCLLVAICVRSCSALYFYIDGSSPKCFFEDLPKDTLVVGHFSAEAWVDASKAYLSSSELGVYITVDEVFDNMHRIVSQTGASKGRFTFSAADSGEHRLCFQPTGAAAAAAAGGWLSGAHPAGHGGIKFTLDMAIGETSAIEGNDRGKIEDMVLKVKDLNARLQDVRREQVYQREREAEFRDQSESTNARVVRWSLVQLAILGVTCAWQLSHLRSFFIKQKLT